MNSPLGTRPGHPRPRFEVSGSRGASALAMWLVLAAVLIGFTSCSIQQAAPVKRTFLLEARRPAKAGEPAARSAGALRVRGTTVSSPFAGRGFVYRRSDWSYEADFYDEFLVAPRNLVDEQVRRWLGEARMFAQVLEPSGKSEFAFSLEPSVTALFGDYRDRKAATATLEIQFALFDEQATPRALLWERSYRREVPLAAPVPDRLVAGWSQAFGEILGELEKDLSGAVSRHH